MHDLLPGRNFAEDRFDVMNEITWVYYDVWCGKRRCQVLVPEDVSQIWVTQYSCPGPFGVDFDFWGNRKGLTTVRNACAVLAEDNDFIVYLPCKKNFHLFLQDYCSRIYGIHEYKFVDFVFIEPGAVKIDDWKQIRNRIRKMRGKKWNYHFQNELGNMCKKDKNVCWDYWVDFYRIYYRYDTVFLNYYPLKYPELASQLDCFLDADLEHIFLEDMIRNDKLRGEGFLWSGNKGLWGSEKYFDSGVLFWDDEIYQKIFGRGRW